MPFEIYLINDKLDKKVTGFESLVDFEIKKNLVFEVLRSELLNYRQGNAHTKTRAEVRGGGKKPWKQKGTGRARHGSIRSPLWIGGGITFGPRNDRNWHSKINKKAKLTALKSILKDKLDNQNVFQLNQDTVVAKTKQAVEILNLLSQKTGKTKGLVVYTQADKATLNGFANSQAGLIDAQNLKLSKLANSPFLILTPGAKLVLENKISLKKTTNVKSQFKIKSESKKTLELKSKVSDISLDLDTKVKSEAKLTSKSSSKLSKETKPKSKED